MSNLRQAAQQALEALEYIHSETSEYEDKVIGEAIASLRAALAEPEQPHTLTCVCGAGWDIHADGREELAAAPAPRKPLTDEEIDAAAKSVPAAVYELMHGHEISVEKFRAALAEFARAIERAHGIGSDA